MKNLLNCHVIGMHSFPVTETDNLYERIFTTTSDHVLHDTDKMQLAIHPHHVNITITVLKGVLTNIIYQLNPKGAIELDEYIFSSVIKNGYGGFKKIGTKNLVLVSEITYKKGDSFSMESCDMHTVRVPKGMESAWLVQEDVPTCDYFPVSYSDMDLERWNQLGMYQPVNDRVRDAFIGDLDYHKYLRPNSND